MMVAAWGEGIGSCPAHLPEAELARLLGIPPGLEINRVIGFGYVDPARAAPPGAVARRRLPLEELVHWESGEGDAGAQRITIASGMPSKSVSAVTMRAP